MSKVFFDDIHGERYLVEVEDYEKFLEKVKTTPYITVDVDWETRKIKEYTFNTAYITKIREAKELNV